MISVVIPAFNEQENIPAAAERLGSILAPLSDYELIFVDDGSKDGTWELIKQLGETDEHIRGLHFSRNFGKEGAVFAGLKAADGDCVAVIDCDLQHPPELLEKMYAAWKNGAEVVEAVKASRGKEGIIYKLFAKTFYRMMKNSSAIDLDGASDYKLMDRKVVNALNEMPERLTFFRALSSWVGFRTERVDLTVAAKKRRQDKMVVQKAVQICYKLNNQLYKRAYADNHLVGSAVLYICRDTGYTDPCQLLYRKGGRRLFDRNTSSAYNRQYTYARYRHYGILSQQDIRGDKAASEIYSQ